MSTRPSRETLESLRLTLQKLEQTADPTSDAQAVAELKRIIVKRIADLEMLDALDSQSSVSTPSDKLPEAALVDPPPLAVVAPDEPPEEAIETAPDPASNN